MKYEKPIFPMDYMNITQGYNGSYSHQGVMAIDLAGKDSGKDRVKAPCTSLVKAKSDAGVYLESINKVKCADGTLDYITCYMYHDNDIRDIKVGQVIQQGQYFYDEGTFGNATGNHIHLIVAKGKYQGGFFNSYKRWCLKNQVAPETVLWVSEDTKIIRDGGYKWNKTKELFYEEPVKPIYNGSSIIEYLNSVKIDSSFKNRRILAVKYSVVKYAVQYIGTAKQNLELLKRMRGL